MQVASSWNTRKNRICNKKAKTRWMCMRPSISMMAEHRFFHSTLAHPIHLAIERVLNGCASCLSSSICICTSTTDVKYTFVLIKCWRFRCSAIIRFSRWPQSHSHTLRNRTTSASAKFNIYASSIKLSRPFDSHFFFHTNYVPLIVFMRALKPKRKLRKTNSWFFIIWKVIFEPSEDMNFKATLKCVWACFFSLSLRRQYQFT